MTVLQPADDHGTVRILTGDELEQLATAPPAVDDPAGRMTAATAGWLLSTGTSAATRDAYQRDLHRWMAWCAERGLDPLAATRGHVDAWIATMGADGDAVATQARRIAAVSSWYSYLAEDINPPLVTRNPTARVRRPRAPQDSTTDSLGKTEAVELLAAARTAGPRDEAVVCLLTLNGLRVSEVCAAQTADLGVERGHRYLRVTRKGGRVDRVALAPRTAVAIDSHLDSRDDPDGPLLIGNDGQQLDRWRVTRIVKRLGRAARIGRDVHPHMLRHTAITLALLEGAPLHEVQDFAGHADPRTTRRYDRAARSLDRHVTYRLAAALDDGD